MMPVKIDPLPNNAFLFRQTRTVPTHVNHRPLCTNSLHTLGLRHPFSLFMYTCNVQPAIFGDHHHAITELCRDCRVRPVVTAYHLTPTKARADTEHQTAVDYVTHDSACVDEYIPVFHKKKIESGCKCHNDVRVFDVNAHTTSPPL